MLILKQNANNSVPTPSAGKGTVFLNTNDQLSVKTSSNVINVVSTVPGSNTQIAFNDNGALGGNANLTFDKANSQLTVVGNAVVSGIKTDNYMYANGDPFTGGGGGNGSPGGANTYVQFNDVGNFGGTAGLTFNKTTNAFAVAGNLTSGNAALGNLAAANYLSGTLTTASQPNITSVGTLSSLSVTANITAGNINGGNAVSANFFIGDGGLLTNIAGGGGSSITNGNSNVSVAANGNVSTSVNGVSNVQVVTSTGVTYTGNLLPSSNVTYSLGSPTNAWKDLYLSGSTLYIADETMNVNATSGIWGFSSNGGFVTLGTDSNLANSVTSNYFIGDGGLLTNISTASGTYISNGTSNVAIPAANGNVTVNVAGNSNVVVISGDGINVAGYSNITGNISAGNLYISGTANIGGNTGGNISGANIISANTLNAAVTLNAVNAVISGNLTVSGTTTYVNVTNLNVQDPLINLGGGPNGAPLTTNDGKDRGTLLEYYTSAPVTAFMGWDNSNAEFALGSNVSVSNEVVTFNTLGNLRAGSANLGNSVTSNYFIGDGGLLTNISAPAGSSITNGNSNVVVAANSNVTVSVAGNSNVLTVTGTSVLANILAANTVNVATALNISGNTTWGNGSGGNITGANVISANTVNVATAININGTVTWGGGSGGNITGANNISANTLTGALTTASQPNITSIGTLSSLTVTGNVTANNFAGNGGALSNLTFGNIATLATANLTTDEIYLQAVTRLDVTANGTAGYIFDQYGASNNPALYIQSGQTLAFNLSVAGHPFLIQTSGGANYSTGLTHVATNGTVTNGSGALGQTVGTLYWKVPYGITGNYKYQCSAHAGMNGNIVVIDANISNVAGGSSNSISNGNSNVVVSANSNVTVSVAGNANILTVTDTGVNVAGTLNATGNLAAANLSVGGGSGGNITGANLISANTVNVATTLNIAGTASFGSGSGGNITGANVISANYVNVSVDLTVTGNASAGNLTVSGVANLGGGSGGNLTGANVISANTIEVATLANLGAVANVSITGGSNGNVLTTYGNGVLYWGAAGSGSSSNISNGNSNVNAGTANGNITVSVAGNSNVVVFTGTGVNVAGTLNSTGNLTAGNVSGGNLVSANYLAGVLTTASQPNITSIGTLGSLTVTGNASAGNLTVSGVANLGGGSGGNLTGANVISANYVNVSVDLTVTGNANIGNGTGGSITGANLLSANYVNVATQLTVAGNLVTSGVSGNISGANVISANTINVANDAIITGNLTVNGNLIYINVEELSVEDPIINLQTGPNGAAPTSNSGKDVGTALNYYDTEARVAFMGWDVSNAEFGFGKTTTISSEVVTFTDYGNIRASYFIGNGSQLTGVVATGSNISNGNSNVSIASSAGNVTVSVNGNANILTITDTGLVVNGTANLGSVSNITITGGNANYVLSTDGAGNLSWAAQSGGGGGSTATTDAFTGNGVQTSFTLSVTPASKDWTTVNYNGVIMLKSDYSLAGNVISFTNAPANGSKLEVTSVTTSASGITTGKAIAMSIVFGG